MRLTDVGLGPRVQRTAAAFCAAVLMGLAVPGGAAPAVGQDQSGSAVSLPEGPVSGAVGVVVTTQTAAVRASKMFITVGPDSPIWAAMYFGMNNFPIDDPTSYLPTCLSALQTPCVPYPFYQPECATEDPATQQQASYFRNDLYPVLPLGVGESELGVLARTSVRLLAFGTIPATATITMRLVESSGSLEPLTAHIWDTSAGPQGCAPLPAGSMPTSALVEGKINIELSDLVIDGAPVDLGPSCRTNEPADVYLWGEFTDGEGGYSPNRGGNLGAYDGLHTGSLFPLDHPLYVEDNGRTIPASTGITVPAFTGCGAGGEDLSEIVTAMASGENNPVRAVQGELVATGGPGAPVPLDNLAGCNPSGQCPLPGPGAPELPPVPNGEIP